MGVAGSALVVATRDPLFWRCYAFDDGDGFDFVTEGERLARRLNGVDDDEDWDEEDDDDLSSIRAILPERRGWWLGLEFNFELALHVLYLQKDEYDAEEEEEEEDDDEDDDDYYPVPDVSLELGHWDQARWHPFCLRWSEVEAVVARMRAASFRLEPRHELGAMPRA